MLMAYGDHRPKKKKIIIILNKAKPQHQKTVWVKGFDGQSSSITLPFFMRRGHRAHDRIKRHNADVREQGPKWQMDGVFATGTKRSDQYGMRFDFWHRLVKSPVLLAFHFCKQTMGYTH